MSKALKYIKIILGISLWPIYWLSGFFPRDPKIWVFGSSSGTRFADNAKHLFLYCHNNQTDIKVIWITRDTSIVKSLRSNGMKAFHAYSVFGLWYSLRAGVYIFDCYIWDINSRTSKGAAKVNLWHGIPLKKIERDIDKPDNASFQRFHPPSSGLMKKFLFKIKNPSFLYQYDMIISTSPVISNLFTNAFGLNNKNIIVTGYPRNDVLLSDTYIPTFLDLDLYVKLIDYKKRGNNIIVYVPTFRDSIVRRKIPINWDQLNSFLKSRNSLFILKLHVADTAIIPSLDELRNIIYLPPEADIYPLLRQADILITDYSSIFFDFLLLNKPIVFYAYDLDFYIKRDRSMYFEYNDITPGPKVYNFDELLRTINDLLVNRESRMTWAEKRDYVIRMCHTYIDANSSRRVFEEIYNRFVHIKKGSFIK